MGIQIMLFKHFVVTLLILTYAYADLIELFKEVPGQQYNVMEYYSEKKVKNLEFLELCKVVATYEYSTKMLRLHFNIQSEDEADKDSQHENRADYINTLETI